MDEKKRLGEYDSVGGSSTHILFNFPGYGALYMGSLVTISYSTFRDKTPVYNLGGTNIDGFALGKRYIAGSLVKAFFMNDDLKQFLTKIKNDIGITENLDSLYSLTRDNFKTYHHLLIDDIVPFDIIIVLCSEYGDWSVSEVIYGATFINTGQVYSIDDIMTETTMSFIANDVKMTHDKIGSQISSLVTPSTSPKASNIKAETRQQKTMDDYLRGITSYSQLLKEVEEGRAPAAALIEYARLERLAGNKDPVNLPSVRNQNIPKTPSGSTPYGNSQNPRNGQTYSPIDINVSNLVKDNIVKGVENIHDGDTIAFKVTDRAGRTKNMRMRLMGIDTPETEYTGANGKTVLTQRYGKEALDYAQNYIDSGRWDADVLAGKVRVVGVDKYGRTLIYNSNYAENITRNGLSFFNAALSYQSGMTQEEIRGLSQAVEYARANKAGMWDGKAPMIDPSVWRKMPESDQKEYLDKYGR